jgi:hypothetical protein
VSVSCVVLSHRPAGLTRWAAEPQPHLVPEEHQLVFGQRRHACARHSPSVGASHRAALGRDGASQLSGALPLPAAACARGADAAPEGARDGQH